MVRYLHSLYRLSNYARISHKPHEVCEFSATPRCFTWSLEAVEKEAEASGCFDWGQVFNFYFKGRFTEIRLFLRINLAAEPTIYSALPYEKKMFWLNTAGNSSVPGCGIDSLRKSKLNQIRTF